MKLVLNVQYACNRRGVPAKSHFTRWVRAAMRGSRRARVEVTVRVVDIDEGARLNADFLGRRGPTNVLSFPCKDRIAVRQGLLGDIAICAPVVAREAKEQNKPEIAHWAHMVVHAIMHLRGFDHKTSSDAKKMEAREIRALKDLGFSNPYLELPTHERKR